MTNDILGVIPARYQSTRFPGKPLADIFGKPMIYWTAKRVAASKLEKFVVATDDDRILEACREYSIPCMLTPVDCENGTERVAHVARSSHYKYYVNIQGDEPCLDSACIDTLIESIDNNENFDFLQAVTRTTDVEAVERPEMVKVAVSQNSDALYFSRSVIPFYRGKGEKSYYRCLGLYVYSREFLAEYAQLPPSSLEKIEVIEQLRILENGYRIRTVEVYDEGVSVDTPEDLDYVVKNRSDWFQNK